MLARRGTVEVDARRGAGCGGGWRRGPGRWVASVASVVLIVATVGLVSARAASAATAVTTAAGLAAAFDDASGTGYLVSLGADITVTDSAEPIAVPAGQSVTLDLAGFTLNVTGGTLLNAGIAVPSGTSLIIEDTIGGGTLNASTILSGRGAGIGGNGEQSGGSITINTGTVTPPDSVTVNDYLLTFDPNGGSGGPGDLRVYATTLAAAGLGVPAATPTRPGFDFTGWFPTAAGTGTSVTTSTVLGTGNGPATVTVFAGWAPAQQPTATTLTGRPLLSTLFAPSARLTTTGTRAPIPGQTVAFSAHGHAVCSAVTNADGVATCRRVFLTLFGLVATYAGNSDYQPATGTVPLLCRRR